ncbi:Cytochrome c4 [Oceanococcus atlanticus]|uniref:Cytochrome c4 n=1 Tax=Oceanococcus atlanticus TaxID=1317117 RepID=A0A1Y1SI94_9GAMM|nr:cytochrome c [Oceanococcus atlanticus]ORE89402.1 Cytochrome c4 [Oceanococcus atlanticus]RZO84950.1 MAG: cytochrome c [Oceanococcus sp.]
MKSWAYAGGLGLLLSALSAQAAGDVEAGKVKADTCMGCHGIVGYTNAYPTYRVPRLGGQHAAYLEAALKAYRSGDRKHPTMHAQAATMSDQDIADLAAWLSQAGNAEEK